MVRIRAHAERAGLQLSDPIEGAYYELTVAGDDPPALSSAPESAVPVPVDEAVQVHTATVALPKRLEVGVWTADMERVGTVDPEAPARPPGVDPVDEAVLEVYSAPMKLYLRLPGGFRVDGEDGGLRFRFEEPRAVTVAARSFRSEPAGTVTAGPSVDSEMRAVSTLGSALGTTTPDRAWPTLRGHPPLLEAGASESIPDAIQRPDVDVTLHLPRDREHLYLAAPLAYYLAARVVPTAGRPRLEAAGTTRVLEDVQSDLNTLLRRVFLLDTLADSGGAYAHDLACHDAVRGAIDGDVDWERLYGMPPGERTAAYLAPRFDPVVERDLLPSWHVTTDVAPRRASLGTLPFVAQDLSLVRTAESVTEGAPPETPEAIAAFMRTGGDHGEPLDIVQPPPADTPEHQWVGETPAWETTHLDERALRRRATGSPPGAEDHVTSVRLVCNDPAMSDEFVEEIYGLRDLLDYDITAQYDLTADELAAAFRRDDDLLHYIGHVEGERGLQCAEDGWLDLRSLDDVRVDTFVLNACRSYEQGQALLDAGAYAGVVTLRSVDNALATRIGQQLARLLDTGLRFRSALSIIQSFVPASHRYVVLGAGGHQLVQSESGCPLSASVSVRDDDEFELSLSYHPTRSYGVGSLVKPVLPPANDHHLGVATVGPWRVDGETLAAFCEREQLPVDFEGELLWTSELALVLSSESDRRFRDLLAEKYQPLARPNLPSSDTNDDRSLDVRDR
jgi:hypothetical protein